MHVCIYTCMCASEKPPSLIITMESFTAFAIFALVATAWAAPPPGELGLL